MTQRHFVQNNARMLVTTVTKERKPLFANDAYAREAIEALYRTRERQPFFLHGFVIMPDHCHILLFVPESGSISSIMNSYKTGVANGIGIGSIWQRRFHIRLVEHGWKTLRYVHQNPVKAGLCTRAEDYSWSSASGKWDVDNLECW